MIRFVRPFDAVLTVIAVLASAFLFTAAWTAPGSFEAEVWQDGRRILILKTGRNAEWEVSGAFIETGPAGIRVRSSDCPNRHCVRQGWISRSGRSIVCVPKRMTIRMVPEAGGNGIDGVSE